MLILAAVKCFGYKINRIIMVILIAGATHTGKTFLSQKILEKYKFPYLSIDHLKMGLIRSNLTNLTVYDDNLLLPYLWNIVKEIIKTAIENGQNLIVEGCYIPFDWRTYFCKEYLDNIKCLFLVMSEEYILKNYSDILSNANCIENRATQDCSDREELIKENIAVLKGCKQHECSYFYIDKEYPTFDEIINKLQL